MKEDFKKLNIDPNLLKNIEKEGLKRSTPIQFKTIPLIFSGYDIIASSPAKSGKTLSYVLALIQNLSVGVGLQAVIIVPSKEHAKIVGNNFKLFTKNTNKPLKLLITTENNKLKVVKEKLVPKVDVLISTPLRIKELINEKDYDFSKVSVIVLDDVDSMFEVTDFDKFNFILRNMPKKKQMVVFSTSITQEVYLKIRYWMRMPKRVTA